MKIFIIDDDSLITIMLKSILEKIDPLVEIEFRDFDVNVIDQFMLFLPDVVFCDIFMPHKDGFDIMSDISRHLEGNNAYPNGVRFIIMSGQNPKYLKYSEQLSKILNVNVVQTMEKPLDYNVINKIMKPLLKLIM